MMYVLDQAKVAFLQKGFKKGYIAKCNMITYEAI